MAAQDSPFTNLCYSTEHWRKGGDWTAAQKLEDLQRGDRLVKSFFEGQLRLSYPLIFTQAGRQSFDGQFLSTLILGELLTSEKVSYIVSRPGRWVYLIRYRFTG